jgi:thymidylate synthase
MRRLQVRPADYTASAPGPFPREILRKPASIDPYDYEDFVIHDYQARPHIKAAVAV